MYKKQRQERFNAVPSKILIVDDVMEVRNLLKLELRQEGYEVELAENGLAAQKVLEYFLPDLIILDVVMPQMNGWEFLTFFRRRYDIPIIMLTALGQTQDIVQSLDWGADDYLCKPFEMGELLARIRNALRHSIRIVRPETAVLRCGEIVIDCIRHEVMVKGENISLSPKEYDLLEYLVRNFGEPLMRKRILKDVWGTEEFVDEKTVDVYVHFLRKKLRRAGLQSDPIKALRGVGYQMQKHM